MQMSTAGAGFTIRLLIMVVRPEYSCSPGETVIMESLNDWKLGNLATLLASDACSYYNPTVKVPFIRFQIDLSQLKPNQRHFVCQKH